MARAEKPDLPDIVQTTIRLRRDDWRRLRILAMDQGVSLQSLFIDALNLLLEKHGKPLAKVSRGHRAIARQQRNQRGGQSSEK